MKNKLLKRSNGGFSLVELIVVIAIMAILVGVAVPVYSSYIEKSQMNADRNLVAEIKHAVEIYDASTGISQSASSGVLGYIVLTTDSYEVKDLLVDANGAEIAFLRPALEVFSADTLRLKYDEWKDAAVVFNAAANNIYKGSIGDSTFKNEIGTEELLTEVQNCSTALGGFLNGLGDAPEKMVEIFGDDYKNILKAAGYEENDYDDVTAEVLSNATVFAIANVVKQNPQDVINNYKDPRYLGSTIGDSENVLYEVANWYSAAKAFVSYLNDPACTQSFAQIDMTGNMGEILASMGNAYTEIDARIRGSLDLQAKYNSYYGLVLNDAGTGAIPDPSIDGTTKKSQAQIDGEAYVGIMSTVNGLEGDYIGSNDLMNDSELFAGSELNGRLNGFLAATSLGDLLASDGLLKAIASDGYDGSAIVLVFSVVDGQLSYTACPAGVVE